MTFNRQELQDTLTTALDFIPKGDSLPILGSALFNTQSRYCAVSATDLEKSFTRKLKWSGDAVSRCIPLKLLSKEVKALDSDITEVELCFTKGDVKVNGRCRILTISHDNFPSVSGPVKDGNQIRVVGMAVKLKRVLKAADNDAAHGTGSVCFDIVKGRMVANDGRRLHMDEIPSTKTARNIVIPQATAAVMAKHPDSGIVDIGSDTISINLSGGLMTAKLLDGDYPKYEEVIPKDMPVSVTFSGSEFLKVMQGVSPITTQDYQLVKLTVNGKLEVEINNPEQGHYKWHIPCKSKGKGDEDFTIGFNVRYLIDAVSAYTDKENDTVTMALKDKGTACLINKKAVLMPMNLS